MAALMIWIFLGTSAMADDNYGTYRLDEMEFARIAGNSHTFKISVWKKNKDIIQTPAYALKKVLGIYRLDQQETGNAYKSNVFVWLKKPKTSKPDMKLVKSGGKITLVHVDRKQDEKYKDIQLAQKSTEH